MTGSLPPFAAVRAFEAAARRLSFTEAGQELGLTQAAVSYQIKLLEERLGITLFHRVGRRIELSAPGQALAATVIRAFDELRGGFANLRAESSAVLTISCTHSFANLWLAPRIGQFQMLKPELAVRIHASDQIIDFAREGVDVAIRGGDGAWPGLEAEMLTRNYVVPLCSPDFLARAGPIAHAADLLRVARLSPHDQWWTDWFAAMDIEPEAGPPAIALDSQMMEGRAALAGQGVAIVNPFFWKSEIEAGLLVEPVPFRFIETMRYWITCVPAARNQPKVKAFRDWIRAEFAAARAHDPEQRYLPGLD